MTTQQNNTSTSNDVGNPELLYRALSGEVIVIPQLMNKAGILQIVRAAVTHALQELAGDIVGNIDSIDSINLDKLHQLLPPELFPSLTEATDRILSFRLARIYKQLLGTGFGYRDPIWVLKHPITRIVVPFDAASSVRDQYRKFNMRRQGRVATLRPHRDSWYSEPLGCINLWLPFSTIVPGNGVALFTQEYNRPLNYIADCGVTRNQRITRSLEQNMQSGDALIFHANHLHGSELNRTDITRCVLSLRLSLSDPRFETRSPHRYCQVKLGNPISFLQLHHNKYIRRFAARLYRPFMKEIRAAPQISRTNDVRCGPDEQKMTHTHRSARDHISITDLENSNPLAISDKEILVKIAVSGGVNQVWQMERRCPHEGADLALGHIDGDNIHCPWHGLPIDIRTGASPCQSLRPLQTRRCSLESDVIVTHRM